MEVLYLASSEVSIDLPQEESYDPPEMLELVGFFSHSLFDPTTARKKRGTYQVSEREYRNK